MRMKKFSKTCMKIMAFSVIALFFTNPLFANEKATPEEIMKKVQEASAFLEKNGAEGLKAFADKTGPWVWKDSYIFVFDCKNGLGSAHPFKPKLVGNKKLMSLKDTKGKLFFAHFCVAAEQPGGGWVEYTWPKVGEKTPSRKITYVLQVPGTIWQIAAGIYNDHIAISDLNKLIGK